MKEPTHILAIESSCDDTSAAVLSENAVLSNLIANQEVHHSYGGVVPELASRAHQANILPVVHQALEAAGVLPGDIDAVAFTQGPGLLGSLLVGSSFAKGLAWSLNKPLIEVNHMQAHVLAHFIKNDLEHYPEFPFLCLTVSGGHTQLVLVKSPTRMKIVGQTLDDAVGEAFDKIAKLLGLPYPGGPHIDKLAKKGNPGRFTWPEAGVGPLEFSFSGIKTSVMYFLRDQLKSNKSFIEDNIHDLCASIQQYLVGVLMKKLKAAELHYKTGNLAIAGGVSANSSLREQFQQLGKQLNCDVFVPPFEYCTDNAAMIGIAGYYKYKESAVSSLQAIPKARLSFDL